MEEQKNFSWKDVVEMSETFPWQPTFNKVIITLNRELIEGTLDLSGSTMDEEQFIISAGPHVKGYLPGDVVLIDLEKLMVTRPNPNDQDEQIGQLKLDTIFDDEDNIFAIIEDRFIKAKRTNQEPLQSNE